MLKDTYFKEVPEGGWCFHDGKWWRRKEGLGENPFEESNVVSYDREERFFGDSIPVQVEEMPHLNSRS